jgi:hypothetical protein
MITVVSGLPRSGTSLMMQMLLAGGLPALTDAVREPDADNPRGYLEWEPVKRLAHEPSRIREAEGKAVKVVSALLPALPNGHDYRILFLRRPHVEVVASQTAMLKRSGKSGPALEPSAMARAFDAHIKQVLAVIHRRPASALREIEYHAVLADPRTQAVGIQSFLDLPLDVDAMASAVDPSLHRQRIR